MKRWTVALVLAVLGVAALVVGFLRRHHPWIPEQIEGAYFNRSPGGSSAGGSTTILVGDRHHNAFDPFHVGDPYLWLGIGVGLLLAAVGVVVMARVADHTPG